MNALRLSWDTRNAANCELIEEKLVHFRFKFSARGTRIVVIGIAVNAQGITSDRSLKPLCKPSRMKKLSGSFKSTFSQAWKFNGQSSSGGKSMSIRVETSGGVWAGLPTERVINGHCF